MWVAYVFGLAVPFRRIQSSPKQPEMRIKPQTGVTPALGSPDQDQCHRPCLLVPKGDRSVMLDVVKNRAYTTGEVAPNAEARLVVLRVNKFHL